MIPDKYDVLVEYRAQPVARLLQQADFKHILIHKDILSPLKHIAKRMLITANTLADRGIKSM